MGPWPRGPAQERRCGSRRGGGSGGPGPACRAAHAGRGGRRGCVAPAASCVRVGGPPGVRAHALVPGARQGGVWGRRRGAPEPERVLSGLSSRQAHRGASGVRRVRPRGYADTGECTPSRCRPGIAGELATPLQARWHSALRPQAIRDRPHSLVVLENPWQAHPDVRSLLAQVLQRGVLTDSQGRTADFSHCVIAVLCQPRPPRQWASAGLDQARGASAGTASVARVPGPSQAPGRPAGIGAAPVAADPASGFRLAEDGTLEIPGLASQGAGHSETPPIHAPIGADVFAPWDAPGSAAGREGGVTAGVATPPAWGEEGDSLPLDADAPAVADAEVAPGVAAAAGPAPWQVSEAVPEEFACGALDAVILMRDLTESDIRIISECCRRQACGAVTPWHACRHSTQHLTSFVLCSGEGGGGDAGCRAARIGSLHLFVG